MLRRILVANRGEIVARIARTTRRLGMTCIAVYSDADRHARHVRVSDEAYHLGGSPPAESYLDGARILRLAKRVGADAVHPGYGFLSENAAFAEACSEAGLAFIGPPAGAIRAMGSKSASKAAMSLAGVPVAAGYHGEDQTLERFQAEADRVGFPLIIKSSAGGGGKGMQVVNGAGDMAAAVASAKRLALTAFADGKLLLERFYPRARHVEVQVFADTHGEVVALHDRDCSVQRRHQKIIEEAPAFGLRSEVRVSMSAAAVTAARAVDYVGAGTVEFLVDEQQNFYFMEMNTRLQVEHPVTEFITGIDLVEWQLRAARGDRLPPGFGAAPPQGAAIEARLYAEDPARDYLPSVGRILHLQWPQPEDGLRLDVGVDAGDDVSPFYDPMLGKIIAWGDSRADALSTLRRALAAIEIVGVTTNRALLASVLAHERFEAADVATDFLSLHGSGLKLDEPVATEEDCLLAAVWFASRNTAVDALWQDTRGWRLGAPWSTTWNFSECSVCIEAIDADRYIARGATGRDRVLTVVARMAAAMDLEMDGQLLRAKLIADGGDLHILTYGRHVRVRLARTEDTLGVQAGTDEGTLITPLPGTVVALHAAVGQTVERGAPLVTVEAMKMEHTLTAPYAGTVERLLVGLKERVAAGATLVELSGTPR